MLAGRLESALRANGDWDRLDEFYRSRLEVVDDDALTLEYAERRARLMADVFKEHRSAFQLFESALVDGRPSLAQLVFGAALGYRAGMPQRGAALYERAAEFATAAELPTLYQAKGRCLFEHQDFEGAERCADQLLALDERDVDALALKGETAAATHNWKDAVLSMRRLIAYHDDLKVKAHNAAGIAEIFSLVFNNSEKAAYWYRQSVQFEPTNTDFFQRLMNECVSLGDKGPHLEYRNRPWMTRSVRVARLVNSGQPLVLLSELVQLLRSPTTRSVARCLRVRDFLDGGRSPDTSWSPPGRGGTVLEVLNDRRCSTLQMI